MTPLPWACCTASQTVMKSFSRSSMPNRSRSQNLVIGSPLTYSITKYGRPSEVVPPSKTRAIDG